MMPKIKNIILFAGIAVVLVLAYVFFVKGSSKEEGNLVSVPAAPDSALPAEISDSSPGKDFLPILLNVKNIKLDDSIFSDPAFVALVDGSLTLVPEGDEGRPNPFAPLGAENTSSSSFSFPSSGTGINTR